MDEKNKVIIDWVSVSSKIHTPENFINDLGLNEITFDVMPGYYGYRQRYFFDGISLHYDGHSDNMGVLLEMSGQGCRNFETYGNGRYESIFADVHDNPCDMNITRLDIAYDDFEGMLNLKKISKKVQAGEYVSHLQAWSVETSSKGLTVSLGSKKSDVYIRIYDKALERGYDDGRHWVRCEIQLRGQRAYAFAMLLLKGKPIGDAFVGVMNEYLRFIECDATRKENCSTSSFWIKFLKNAAKIRIYEKPGKEYNEISLRYYVVEQAGNSIFTYVQLVGWDTFKREIEGKLKNLNRHQLHLIAEHERQTRV